MEERLVELETKTAFLEQTVEQLNEVIIGQQKQVDLLTKELGRLEAQMRQVSAALPEKVVVPE